MKIKNLPALSPLWNSGGVSDLAGARASAAGGCSSSARGSAGGGGSWAGSGSPGGSWVWIWVAATTTPDGWTGAGVGSSIWSTHVDVDVDVGVALLVESGNSNKWAWAAASTSSDDELSTLWVELWVVGLVESEEFVSDEIFSGWEGSWDSGSPLEGVLDLTRSPLSFTHGAADETDLVDFELNGIQISYRFYIRIL